MAEQVSRGILHAFTTAALSYTVQGMVFVRTAGVFNGQRRGRTRCQRERSRATAAQTDLQAQSGFALRPFDSGHGRGQTESNTQR